MTRVDNIETAVGEYNFLAMGASIFQRGHQLLLAHDASLCAMLPHQRATQFGAADGGGSQFTDHDTTRQVGQGNATAQGFPGGNASRQY